MLYTFSGDSTLRASDAIQRRRKVCVAYPGKVIAVTGNVAEVDFNGNIANVNIGLVDVKAGGYVLVHAGMAIEAMDESKARGILEVWEQLFEV
jgi:hydrogenase expression/formation protein HypC